MGAWRQSPEGEWWEDDLGVVIGVQGTVWFGYPETGRTRIGPFASRLEAQRALERERRGEADIGLALDGDGCDDLEADDDRPTEKRLRPDGL